MCWVQSCGYRSRARQRHLALVLALIHSWYVHPLEQLSTLWQRSLTPTLHSTTETEFSTGLLAFTFADAFTTTCQLPGHKTLRPLWLRHSLIQQKWGLEKPLMSSNQEESQLLPPCLCRVLSCLWKPQTATVVLIQRKRPLVEI